MKPLYTVNLEKFIVFQIATKFIANLFTEAAAGMYLEPAETWSTHSRVILPNPLYHFFSSTPTAHKYTLPSRYSD
jgi:hypothetical protein